MSSDSKALVGFIVGVSAGVVAGLLLAPQAGEATRQQIADRTSDYSTDFEDKLNVAIEKLTAYTENAVGQARVSAESAANNARAAVAEYEAKAKERIESAKS